MIATSCTATPRDLAHLAMTVAQLTPGDERWRRRLEVYVLFPLALELQRSPTLKRRDRKA